MMKSYLFRCFDCGYCEKVDFHINNCAHCNSSNIWDLFDNSDRPPVPTAVGRVVFADLPLEYSNSYNEYIKEVGEERRNR